MSDGVFRVRCTACGRNLAFPTDPPGLPTLHWCIGEQSAPVSGVLKVPTAT